MNDELVVYKRKFSKVHLLLSLIFLMFILVQLSSGGSTMRIAAVLFSCALVLSDGLVAFVKLYRTKKIWYAIRIIELILLTISFFQIVTEVSSVFLSASLVLTILELLMMGDFQDVYSRTIVTMISSLPAIIYMIVMLFIDPGEQMEFFGMICAYGVIIICIVFLSDILSYIITTTDHKVFELQRLSENMKKTNEILSNQQEKIRKANEELGIQKIKLETAYHKINSANAETTIQNMILNYISSSLEMTTLLNLITEAVYEALGLDLCAVIVQPGIAGNDEVLYQIRSRLGNRSEELLSQEIKLGCLESYVKSKETFIDNHVQAGNYPFLEEYSVNSLLTIPLIKEEIIQGALICGKKQFDFFHDNIQFFETVVNQLQVAIHNASLYARMQQMATRDSLTGIYNRGHLNLLLDRYSKEAKVNATPLSVALLDIDYFKKINDTYGHLFGDKVIKGIANYAHEISIKYRGIAARYGGEEFVLVLPNRSVVECKLIVEELCTLIRNMKLRYEEDIVTAKVSVGLSSYPETCRHITELLNRADSAMYYAKKNGRDQLVIDNDEIYEVIKVK